jgi:hypothetical protein
MVGVVIESVESIEVCTAGIGLATSRTSGYSIGGTVEHYRVVVKVVVL